MWIGRNSDNFRIEFFKLFDAIAESDNLRRANERAAIDNPETQPFKWFFLW